MCSIGWIRLNGSWILFKNRDRPGTEIKANLIISDEMLIGFSDNNFSGLWSGVNKHGVGVATAFGPAKEVKPSLSIESAKINEYVLRTCKSTEEAIKRYKECAKNISAPLIALIGGYMHASCLEIANGEIVQERFEKAAVKTNHFTGLPKYNPMDERTKRSKARLRKLQEFLPQIMKGKDMIPVLSYHSKDEYENICRHDYSLSAASAIFEVRENTIKVYYVLNDFPHTGRYLEKTAQFI